MGFLIYVRENLINWNLRKLDIIARSSIESECRAIATSITNLEWVRNTLLELGIIILTPMTFRSDNLGVSFLASNLV